MLWWGRGRRESRLRRLVFSARARCSCGAGLAYERGTALPVWDCSAIILGDALAWGESSAARHSNPCTYFEIVSERAAAAHGASTRPE